MAQSNAEIKKIIYPSLSKQTLGRALAQLSLLTKGTPNEKLAAIQENYQRLPISYPKEFNAQVRKAAEDCGETERPVPLALMVK